MLMKAGKRGIGPEKDLTKFGLAALMRFDCRRHRQPK
jgi:hypothetical protein